MTQEVLKLAIQLRDTASGYWTETEIPIIEKLIDALAQPVQEPDRTGMVYYKNNACKAKHCHADDCICWTKAQRAWVNLPDEEIKTLWIQYRAALPRYLCFARTLLARAKEENT